MKKIIYSGFHSNWLSIISILNKKYNWKSKVIITSNEDFKILQNLNKSSEVLNISELRKGFFPCSKFKKKNNFSKRNIGKLSKYFLNFCLSLQTYDKLNEFKNDKLNFYKSNIKFCSSLIHRNKPDLVLFCTWPANSFDYTLYLVAKKIFNIPVLYIDAYEHFNNFYHTIGSDLKELHKPYIKKYKSKNIKKNYDVDKYYNQIKKNFSVEKIPSYKRDIEFLLSKGKTFLFSILKKILKTTLISFVNGKGFKLAPVGIKKKGYSFFNKKAYMNYFEYYIFLINNYLKTIFLEGYYQNLCDRVNLDDKYILYAGALHPEAISDGFADKYHDDFLNLRILSQSLPKGWKIYYKEHFATFLKYESNLSPLKKDKKFFLNLSKIPKVKLISHKSNTIQLVNNSKAVSSLAGTVGMEALINNKPVLIFGNTWYKGCKSIFHIKNINDCKKALKKIKKNFIPCQKDIKKYLYAVASSSYQFKTSLDHERERITDKSVKKENMKIAQKIYQSSKKRILNELK